MKKIISGIILSLLCVFLVGCSTTNQSSEYDIKEYNCYSLLEVYLNGYHIQSAWEEGFYGTLEVDCGNVFYLNYTYDNEYFQNVDYGSSLEGYLVYNDEYECYDMYDLNGNFKNMCVEINETNTILYFTDGTGKLVFDDG